jgi:hypothetical protein
MPAPTSTIGLIDFGIRNLVYEKFKHVMGLDSSTDTENSSIIFLPREIAQREIVEKRGQNKSEFIHVWRKATNRDFARQRTPLAREGTYINYTDSSLSEITKVYTVPALLEYEVGFWSISLDKLQQVVEEYFFWVHRNPNLDINFGGNMPMEIDLKFGDITDSSTISDTYNKGRLFLYTCPITVEAWLPRVALEKTILKIYLKGYVQDKGKEDQLIFSYTIPE